LRLGLKTVLRQFSRCLGSGLEDCCLVIALFHTTHLDLRGAASRREGEGKVERERAKRTGGEERAWEGRTSEGKRNGWREKGEGRLCSLANIPA